MKHVPWLLLGLVLVAGGVAVYYLFPRKEREPGGVIVIGEPKVRIKTSDTSTPGVTGSDDPDAVLPLLPM